MSFEISLEIADFEIKRAFDIERTWPDIEGANSHERECRPSSANEKELISLPPFAAASVIAWPRVDAKFDSFVRAFFKQLSDQRSADHSNANWRPRSAPGGLFRIIKGLRFPMTINIAILISDAQSPILN